jgi:hypothetical protein
MTRPVRNLEVLYRAQGQKTWERVSRPGDFVSQPGHASSLVCTFSADHVGGKRLMERGEFWAQAIVVQNFVSNVDVRFLPRVQVRYELTERGIHAVTMTGFVGDMPELPTQFRWSANASPSFLAITTEREQLAGLLSTLTKGEIGEDGVPDSPKADEDSMVPLAAPPW